MYVGLKYKYISLYFLITIIPVVVISVFTYHTLYTNLKENIIKENLEILKQANNVISMLKEENVRLAGEDQEQTIIYYSLMNSIIGNGSEVLIIKRTGKVVYATNGHLQKQKMFQPFHIKKKGEGIINTEYLNVKRILFYSYNPVTDWYLVVLTPIDVAFEKLIFMKKIMTLIILTSVILLFLVVYFISYRITSPIKLLREKLDELENGNINLIDDKRVLIKDEIYDIGISFNRIIKRYMDLEYDYHLKSNEAKFLALQSQINPHFLHNTMETINSIAIINNVPLISELSRSLSKMFRYNTVNESKFVHLKDEIDHIENYLTVQLIRFNGMIQKNIDVEETVLECKIIKFVLQPLVENCFVHAFRDLTDGGIINISAIKLEDEIIITIEDNGEGIEESKLKEINAQLQTINPKLEKNELSDSTGIGIFNVNSRIKITFGNECGINIQSNKQKGIKLTINIPYA
ncbi:histidine kinase [Neobacillus drentensis]|uniref:sensor histidine kinase n=1 Tax=Neobacillus drentensis TaxID=220684 RepID=UPI002FFD8EE1